MLKTKKRYARMSDEATELKIFIENDRNLYRQQFTPIIKNLITKMARGIYDHNKAIKLFMYLCEAGAKGYIKTFGTRDNKWFEIFDKKARLEVADELATEFEDEAELGNYDEYLPKNYQKQGSINNREVKTSNHKLAKELLIIARDIVSIPMMTLPTTYDERLPRADKLRSGLGIRGRVRPAFSQYLTLIDPLEDHNKFHYFAIYKNPDTGMYVGGNTWGRIGYEKTGRVKLLAESDSLAEVKAAVSKKIRDKMSKGYEIDSYQSRK